MVNIFVTLRTKCALMDVAKRYLIAYKGLKPGLHTFCFDVDRELFEAYDSTEIKDGACQVEVDAMRSETMLELSVMITGEVVVACDRCLEDCRIPIQYEGTLLVKFSEELREYDGDVMWLSPMESDIDLAQYIYESIVLSLPYQRTHPEGECDPEMQRYFRIISGEEFSAIEAKAEAVPQSGEWAKLEQLRMRMEDEKEER